MGYDYEEILTITSRLKAVTNLWPELHWACGDGGSLLKVYLEVNKTAKWTFNHLYLALKKSPKRG